MKKVILTLVLAFTGIFAANAQFWMGGAASVTINKDQSNYYAAPEMGYSFDFPLTIACAADFDYTKNDVTSGWALSLTPYLRYTIAEIEKFSLSLDLLGQFGVKNVEGYRIGIRPIIAWMATDNWVAAFSMGFAGYDNMYNNGAFCIDFATAAPRIGLYYNF